MPRRSNSTVTAGTIARIVSDIAAVKADDGVEFDFRSLDVQQIREEPSTRACACG
jgi:hypothetical protein